MKRTLLLLVVVAVAVSMVAPAAGAPDPISTTNSTTTNGPASGANDYRSTGYGIVQLLDDDASVGSVEETIIDGVTVHGVEWHTDGYALVTMQNSQASPMTLGATDSNDIVSSGHGYVSGVSFTVPPDSTVLVKVPASVRDGDQTIVVSLDVEHQYAWSNAVEPGAGGVGPSLVPSGAMWFVAIAGGVGGVGSTVVIFGVVSSHLKRREDIV